LPANAPGDRCPRCLLKLGLEETDDGTAPDQGGGHTEPDFVLEKPGAIIGRYRLLQEIGQGGFGIVFMAEEIEPVQRKVALKIIKAGMDTREILARFEAERQALAMMDHPNIARVLDGGGTASGRPYFVMELVRGLPITQYCDQANLSTRARLELFIKVCRAVQHAHQKGVIHRDLKPTNVLVTLHDGEPVPKVIDFGVAKALGHKLTEKTLFTRFEQMIGTPAYMSPEQAALGGLDIDTRSDVYSLGVLLYEILTGTTPLDANLLRQGAWDEVRRMIRETDPPKPSSRLARGLEAAAHQAWSPEVHSCNAQGRAVGTHSPTQRRRRLQEHRQRINLVRGDLDWITMKALEKDRQRRYETVNGLAQDIERHLDNEPVVARPPSRLYRFQKFVRRNKLGFGAAAAISAVLVLGVVVSTVEAERARGAELEQIRSRQQAQTEAAKSRQVAQFLKDMLQGVGPSVARGRDTKLLREILDTTAQRVRRELTNQPEVEVELLAVLADTYWELSLYGEMEAVAQEELRAARARFGAEHPAVATALNDLGQAQWQLGYRPQAESTHKEALAMRQKLLGEGHPDIAQSLHNLGAVLLDQGRVREGEQLIRQALEIRRKVLGDRHPDVARSLHTLGNLMWHERNLAEAESLFRRALAIRRELWGDENPSVAGTLNNLAGVAFHQGRAPEAESLAAEALAIKRRLLGDEHPQVASGVQTLLEIYAKQEKWKDAEILLDTLVTPELLARRGGIALLKVRATFHVQRGRWAEAIADFEKGIELDPSDAQLCCSVVPLLVANGDHESYLQHRTTLLAQFSETRHEPTAHRVAMACLILPPPPTELDKAASLADLALAMSDQNAKPWNRFCEGLADYRRGKYDSGAKLARQALDHPEIAWEENGARALDVEAYPLLAMSLYQLGRVDEAHTAAAKCAELLKNEFSTLPSGNWADVLYGQALLKEARTLLGREIETNR
jgi:serine/threonine protein kinase/tetratricopeptide (TPR) repeat protein